MQWRQWAKTHSGLKGESSRATWQLVWEAIRFQNEWVYYAGMIHVTEPQYVTLNNKISGTGTGNQLHASSKYPCCMENRWQEGKKSLIVCGSRGEVGFKRHNSQNSPLGNDARPTMVEAAFTALGKSFPNFQHLCKQIDSDSWIAFVQNTQNACANVVVTKHAGRWLYYWPLFLAHTLSMHSSCT